MDNKKEKSQIRKIQTTIITSTRYYYYTKICVAILKLNHKLVFVYFLYLNKNINHACFVPIVGFKFCKTPSKVNIFKQNKIAEDYG